MKKLLFLLFLTLSLTACGTDEGIYTLTNWEVLFNDNPDFSAIQKESGWQPIKLPNVFHPPVTTGSNVRHLWVRNQFVVTSPDTYFGICMGRVFHTDRLYLNGTKIGSHEFDDISILPNRRNYTIPAGLLKNGDNKIYIYLGTFMGEQAGIASDISLKPKKSFHKTRLFSDLIYIHLPLEILVSSIISLFILLIIFIWNRNERLYLYSSMAVTVYIALLGSMFLTFENVSPAFSQFITWSSIHFFSISLILIIQSLYGIYIKATNIKYIPFLGIIVISIFFVSFFSDAEVAKRYNIIFFLSIISIVTMTPVYFRTILLLNSLKPDRFKFIILSVLTAAGVTVSIVEIYFYITGGRFFLLMLTYCSPFFLLVFSMIFARDRMKSKMELQALYGMLKKISPRDFSSVDDENNNQINEISKKKLDKVTDFIKSNYTSDLSREGLAAAVGMNANYMSGLFKTYTGQKINEYINNLRIEDASTRLTESDEKIIEIAYGVGFESLSTFNRVFKSTTGKTPTEFRDKRA